MDKARRFLASLVTTLIFGFILYKVLERLFVVVWVQMPWWGLILLLVVLFLLIDHMVSRLFGLRD
ncbi:hypothetical protein Mterra_02422 [Calidithermus terrae]|uniref:Uncharacterized protein n=1 Tax=Calidithermus terrae TaxID=1408545 RepID=A0A399ELP4_9DEIN|nr:hypothetical protein [Calidithermus terrae]RIH83071.1 hypothetical protein Mterra_02422 [Calidithermus terrae]